MSVDVVFAAMQEAIQADGPKIHKKFKGTVVFQISDTNDVFSLDLKSAHGYSVTKGAIENADLTVTVESENMIKLISGELKPQQAFMKGLLKIKGKMNLAMKLTAVLAATRKKMPKPKM